jgi:hypothetical protein
MSKPKVKLSNQQKQWLENLEWFLLYKVISKIDNKRIQEVVTFGRYAVISHRNDPSENDYFTSVVGCEDVHTAECMVKYNWDTCAYIVDLEDLMVIKYVERYWKPTFKNLMEKMNNAPQALK